MPQVYLKTKYYNEILIAESEDPGEFVNESVKKELSERKRVREKNREGIGDSVI